MELSIIIPVYNLENYIEDCLKSCLNQDIEDYEIICVDDGSKDNSSVILDRYAREYPGRIKVFHKENGGVSSARNYGLERAQGDWIWFVDGDDLIQKNCIKGVLKNQRAFDLITVQNTMVDEKFSFDKLSFFQSTTKKETNTECIAFKIFSSKIIRRYKLRFNENLTHGEIIFLSMSL